MKGNLVRWGMLVWLAADSATLATGATGDARPADGAAIPTPAGAPPAGGETAATAASTPAAGGAPPGLDAQAPFSAPAEGGEAQTPDARTAVAPPVTRR